MRETTHRGLRLTLASLLMVALVSQLAIGLSRSDLTVVDFFSYFTVLSNAAAVTLLVLLAAKPHRDDSPGFATFRGAVTVYMAVTGFVYALLLSTAAADVGSVEPWIDWSIHVVGPIGVILDWFMDPPPTRLPVATLGAWLAFPAAYLVYSLVRGQIVDWYPYPFLDPVDGGYGSVALWSGVVLIVTLSFGGVFYWWSNRTLALEAS